jgi:hypothetical protein
LIRSEVLLLSTLTRHRRFWLSALLALWLWPQWVLAWHQHASVIDDPQECSLCAQVHGNAAALPSAVTASVAVLPDFYLSMPGWYATPTFTPHAIARGPPR